MAWGADVCARDPVLAALHSLFHAFAAEEAQRRAGGPLTGTAARRGLVDPSQLRQALAGLPGHCFRTGEQMGRPWRQGAHWLGVAGGCPASACMPCTQGCAGRQTAWAAVRRPRS